ncbi:Hsp70 family protein [Prescottella agglutinans]|uniref:Actin-like ATPase involved in cell morphogenesis n=1 Tax=Prescottella agglutinans TaxID=1644129 RepID=A0ABT6MLG3_9NOCA|nr:Hsp70 family protein [Prescottella agglutinans]MDH6284661.1 actin-like ATPase involved in cell morphogenesis [Prescottella agglutinans]
MSSREWVLGIDFGTSNTAAAHTGPVSGTVEALQLSHNRTTMSSAVFVESPDRIAVGDVATDRAEANPAAYMPSPKRVVAQGMVNVNGYDLPASVPVAAVLESVMTRATGAHGGKSPTELVLTHPEAWSPREIQVLLDAAANLGLDASKIRTVSEPRAAAHYYTRANTLAPGSKIAVFDFGGGTLDIAVLEANEAGTFDVVAARGDNGLGGKNLDAYLRRWVDQQLEVRDPDLLDYLRRQAPMDIRYALDDSIRRAKELLSEAPSATITVTGGDGRSEKFQITREEFEELITPTLNKAVQLTRATFADAHITDPSQLEALYLTGGSSRIPLVHERLAELGPIATLDDPKTVVAQGALAAAAPIVRGLGATPTPVAAPAPAPGPAPTPTPGPGPVDARQFPAPTAPETPQPWNPQHPTANRAPAPAAPGWQQPAPGVGAPAKSMTGKKWTVIAAAALAVIAAGAIGVVALTGGEDTPADTTAAAGGPTTTATGGDAASAASSGGGDTASPPSTKDTVVAALPPALRSELEPCKSIGETDNGGMKLQCPIKKGSSLTAGIVGDDYATIIVSVDPREAKKTVIGLRQGFQNNTAVADNVLVENTARTAAAHIEGPRSNNTYSLSYANSSTGVMANFSSALGLDGAKTFLTRSGLIN